MYHLPMGTVTLLFTDMEGSTRLLQQLGERYTVLLEEYRQLLHAAFQRWNGHEVDTQGDAFFVAFARARDAVSGAVAAQRALASHFWPEGVVVRVRMGLHTGEPTLFSEAPPVHRDWLASTRSRVLPADGLSHSSEPLPLFLPRSSGRCAESDKHLR